MAPPPLHSMENIREGGEGCYVTEVNKLQFT